MPTGTLNVTLPVPTARLDGTYAGPAPTDISNAAAGRIRCGGGYVVAPAPATVEDPVLRVDKAIAYPQPDMVDGRAT